MCNLGLLECVKPPTCFVMSSASLPCAVLVPVRVGTLPPPCIVAHVLEGALRRPPQHPLGEGGVRVHGLDISRPSRHNLAWHGVARHHSMVGDGRHVVRSGSIVLPVPFVLALFVRSFLSDRVDEMSMVLP